MATEAVHNDPEPFAFGCECGESRYCRQPSFGAANWAEFWDRHPRRAGIRPLRVEAAIRGGGYDLRGSGHDASERTH